MFSSSSSRGFDLRERCCLRVPEGSFLFGISLLLLSSTSAFFQDVHAVLLVSFALVFHFQVLINVSAAVVVEENVRGDHLTILLSLALGIDLGEGVVAVRIAHLSSETGWRI